MQGANPLLRSIAGAISHSTSKIPHLRVHIAIRRASLRQARPGEPQSLTPSPRHQSTIASNNFIEKQRADSEIENEPPTPDVSRRAIRDGEARVERHPPLDVATRLKGSTENMFEILQEGIPEKILSGLMSQAIGTPFIQHADRQLFNKALLSLDPDLFITPFKSLSRHLKGPREHRVPNMQVIDERLANFAIYLDHFVILRREAGWKLDLEACNHLLRCAAVMGDAQLARSVMKSIMPTDEVSPDLDSYNFYSQALVWSHAFSSVESYNLRVIPRHKEIRASRNPPKNLSGHTTKSKIKYSRGIRLELLDSFQDCMAQGHSASELTFANLMVAMGREGDLDGVKSILKSVWNIDVNLLSTYDEEEVESPTYYEAGHALQPSQSLLYTVAHIFGSNNEVRTAWLLVDYISRNYDLRISEPVWLQLFEWAFVLSLRRSLSQRKQGRDWGKITPETFIQLVATMCDEPHNIKPTAVVHYMLSRFWRDRGHLDNSVVHIGKLKEIVDEQHFLIMDVAAEVICYAQDAQKLNQPDAFATQAFHDLRRRFILTAYELRRDSQLLNIAVKNNLLFETEWAGSGKLVEWHRRKLPEMVQNFTAFLPRRVMYQMKTGKVELRTKYKRHAEIYRTYKIDYRVISVILGALDTDDKAKLEQSMANLPSVVTQVSAYCLNCESIGHTHATCTSTFKGDDARKRDYEHEDDHFPDELNDGKMWVIKPAI